MNRKVCRQCGKVFNYCRSCSFKPIPWKEAGFCSRECSAEHKKPKIKEVVPTEDVEVVVIEEDTSTPIENAIECPHFFTEINESPITSTEEFKSKKKRIKTIEVGQKENDINENEQNNGSII
jgi:hypothetical protein